MYLTARLPEALKQNGITAYVHHQVSPNDEGLCLGQAAIARALMKK